MTDGMGSPEKVEQGNDKHAQLQSELRACRIALSNATREMHSTKAELQGVEAEVMLKEDAIESLTAQHFHYVALAVKLQIQARGMAISVSNYELAELARANKVPSSDWETFVHGALTKAAASSK